MSNNANTSKIIKSFCPKRTLEYVECAPLTPLGREPTWKRHTYEHACLATLVTIGMCQGYSFTRAAKTIAKAFHVGYRRLMGYCRKSFLVEPGHKYEEGEEGGEGTMRYVLVGKMIPYGKLCVYTKYFKYDRARKDSWRRDIEARAYLPAPLCFECREVENEMYNLIDIAFIETYGYELFSVCEKYKEGVEEDKKAIGFGLWCNGVARVPLTRKIEVILDDKRGYTYTWWSGLSGCNVSNEVYLDLWAEVRRLAEAERK